MKPTPKDSTVRALKFESDKRLELADMLDE
jgi:hypothetical protein